MDDASSRAQAGNWEGPRCVGAGACTWHASHFGAMRAMRRARRPTRQAPTRARIWGCARGAGRATARVSCAAPGGGDDTVVCAATVRRRVASPADDVPPVPRIWGLGARRGGVCARWIRDCAQDERHGTHELGCTPIRLHPCPLDPRRRTASRGASGG